MAGTVISRISHAIEKNLTSPPTPSNSNDSSPISSSLRHSTIRGFKLGENSTYYKGLPLAAQGESAKKKCATFTIGTALGGEESPRRPNSNLSASRSKEKTSFKDEVAVGRAATHRLVSESDDEDEDVSESAIEDEDDSSGWEGSDCTVTSRPRRIRKECYVTSYGIRLLRAPGLSKLCENVKKVKVADIMVHDQAPASDDHHQVSRSRK